MVQNNSHDLHYFTAATVTLIDAVTTGAPNNKLSYIANLYILAIYSSSEVSGVEN